jgi:hypothetical protein
MRNTMRCSRFRRARLSTNVLLALIAALLLATSCAREPSQSYDLVIANGRVMDPESGLDAVRHVGIRAGKVEAISESSLAGTRVIDAANHVVAPGFVDLHEHGQQEESYRMMVRDGVTSAFELEVGTGDVAAWYAAREGGQVVNYGVSVGHIPARMKVLGDPGTGLLPAGVGGSGVASEAQMAAMEAILREGLAQGAVAVGFGSAYTPGRPSPRSNACSEWRRRAAHPRTSTCAAVSRGCWRPSPRPQRRARRCTSSTSTRRPGTTSTSSSPSSRPRRAPVRT